MTTKRVYFTIILLAAIIASAVILPACLAEEAADATKDIRISIPSGDVFKEVEFTDTKPFIADEGRIMVPVAPLIDAYNQFDNSDQYQIAWNDEEHKLTLTMNNNYAYRVEYFDGNPNRRDYYQTGQRIRGEEPKYDPSKEAYSNEELVCAPETINGRLYLPIKYNTVPLGVGRICSTSCRFDYNENMLYIGEALYPFNIAFKDENGENIADDIRVESESDVPLPVLEDTESKRFAGWKAVLPNGEYRSLAASTYDVDLGQIDTYNNTLKTSQRKAYIRNDLSHIYDYSWAKTMTLYPIWYDHFPKEEDYASLPDKEFVVPEDEKALFENYYEGYLSSIYGIIPPGTTYGKELTEAPSGLITRYVSDFDNDDHAEMITVCAIAGDGDVGHNICLQIYEIGEDGQPCLKDERPVFYNNYYAVARRTVFVHQYNNVNYICATSCSAGVNRNMGAEHRLLKYNGNKFEGVYCLLDPGYSDGVGLYNVPDNAKNYYDDGEEVYPGKYYSYNDAVMYEGMEFGLKVADYGTWNYTRYNYDGTTTEESRSLKPMYTADNAVWIASIDDTMYEFLLYSEEQTARTVSVPEYE